MLYITQHPSGHRCETQWHVGDPAPKITDRVVEFQADGHELEVILEAIRKASSKSERTV